MLVLFKLVRKKVVSLDTFRNMGGYLVSLWGWGERIVNQPTGMLPGNASLGGFYCRGCQEHWTPKAETGKSVRPMEKKSSLFFFFLLWQDTSIETMPFKTKPIKCKDHARCEKLEAFQHNMDFFKKILFLMYMLKKGGVILRTDFMNGNLLKNCV